MRKPYKTPKKKENWPRSLTKNYLWILSKGVLCRQFGHCGFLSGNHIYIVRRHRVHFDSNKLAKGRQVSLMLKVS
jgi:hypothetical protein